jgi:hypothetical protein
MDTDSKYKPLIGLGFLVVLIAGVSIIPANWFGIHSTVYKNPTLDLSTITSSEEIATDANNDGKISWDEVVNATFKPSSPAALENKQVDPQTIKQLNDPNNLTASFTKNLYISSNYLQQNNITDEASQQQVLDQLIAQEAEKIQPTLYSLSDLHTTRGEDKASIKAYGNELAPIMNQVVTQKVITNDLTYVNSYSQAKDESGLPLLARNRDRVTALLAKLLSMNVPMSASTYHLLALNRVAAYRDTLDNLSKADVDSIRAAIAIGTYQDTVAMVIRLNSTLMEYFDAKNVVFSSQDPGYQFTVGYTLK